MDLNDKKVAIVHDYLNVYGGAEAVTEAIWELFPSADIYTALYDKDAMEKAGAFKGANIIYPKWTNNIPGKIQKFIHKLLIANLPYYFEHLDLSKYDLIISSTAHFAKGVKKTRADQVHVSYIHTPPRFLYGLKGEIRKRNKWYFKPVFWPIDTYLRHMDQQFAKRPDYIICNSQTVKQRIKEIYHLDATVINPFPQLVVSEPEFEIAQKSKGGFYLALGRQAEFKHIDLIIKTCGENNLPLKVAGKGIAHEQLKELASKYKSVEMLGFVTPQQKKDLYKKCITGIYAAEDEDFGMTTLEPMLFGKAVIAYNSGGYRETVEDNVNGIFFDELTPDSLYSAIKKFNEQKFSAIEIRKFASKFSRENFKERVLKYITQL